MRAIGASPRACRPYRAQTKGKVERPIGYLRRNFVYGREFVNDADLNHQCGGWLDQVANVRVHATTHGRPRERFDRDERWLLQPLATRPYISPVIDAPPASAPPHRAPRPPIAVEKRALTTYAELAGGPL